MGVNDLLRRGKRRPLTVWTMLFALLLSVLSSSLAPAAQAKSVRSAVVVSVSGDVTYKKSGGSRSNQLYADANLNQGDLITTGPSSSVVLKIADRDDEITIDENSEVYISALLDEGEGKVSKVKSWAGSMWSKVKSLVSSDDEFEVETPTAVMGVRGTHFLTIVDWKKGTTSMVVAAGVVSAKTPDTSDRQGAGGNPGSTGTGQEVTVYPSQQIELDPVTVPTELRTKVDYTNINELIGSVSPAIIQAIVKDADTIREEQKQVKDKLSNNLTNGESKPDDKSILSITNNADLNKVSNNIDAFLPNIAKQAIDAKKLDQKSATDAKIDPSKATPFDQTAGVDPAVTKEKENQSKPTPAAEKELSVLQQNQQKLATVIQKLEQDKKQIDAANKQAQTQANDKAAAQYVSTLTAAEKTKFESAKSSNTTKSSTGTSGGATGAPSGGGSTTTPPSSDSRPAAPTLVSPTATTTGTNTVEVKLRAPSNTTVYLYNGDTLLGSKAGSDSADVVFTLAPGTYSGLKANVTRGSLSSAPITIPVINVLGLQLTQIGTTQNNIATLALTLKGFTSEKKLYAVEAHLVYNKDAYSYTGAEELSPVSGTVFEGTKTVETLRQVSGVTQYELIYAGTQFETATSGTVNDLQISGDKLLVQFALTAASGTPSSKDVQLAYVKVIDKSTNTVLETLTPQTITIK